MVEQTITIESSNTPTLNTDHLALESEAYEFNENLTSFNDPTLIDECISDIPEGLNNISTNFTTLSDHNYSINNSFTYSENAELNNFDCSNLSTVNTTGGNNQINNLNFNISLEQDEFMRAVDCTESIEIVPQVQDQLIVKNNVTMPIQILKVVQIFLTLKYLYKLIVRINPGPGNEMCKKVGDREGFSIKV